MNASLVNHAILSKVRRSVRILKCTRSAEMNSDLWVRRDKNCASI